MTTNNVINKSFPLSQANGGTGLTSMKILYQIQSSVIAKGSYASPNIPFDNTIPQSSEGSEIGTITLTPKSSSSKLMIYAEVNLFSDSIAAVVYTIALFRDSGADALQTSFGICRAGGRRAQLQLLSLQDSSSTSSTTFKLRIGYASNSIIVNGITLGGSLWSDIDQTSIFVTEYEP